MKRNHFGLTTRGYALVAILIPACGVSAGTVSANNYWPNTIPVASPVWDVSSWRLHIGYLGNGTMQIHNDALVTSWGATIGTFENDGDAVVDGQNAVWSNGNYVEMVLPEVSPGRYGGTASLNITGGGVVGVNGYFTVAANHQSEATLSIAGTDSRLNVEYFYGGSPGKATVSVSGGGLLSSTGGVIGNGPATVHSHVEITGSGSAWTAIGAAVPVTVGRGWGTVDILAGGVLQANELHIGNPNLINANDPVPRGAVTVDGAGSTLDVIGGPISVGHSGVSSLPTEATLTISNGGVANSNGGYIGRINGAQGNVTVEGAGSAWNIANNLYVGASGDVPSGGQGELTIKAGGSVTVGGTILMDDQFGASGTIHLQTGGTLTAGLLNLNAGSFDFTGGTFKTTTVVGNLVNNGGTFSPGASPAISTVGAYQQGPTGTLRIELGGTTAGSEYDRLVVTEQIVLGGTLDVVQIDKPGGGGLFNPTAGQSFDILDFGSILGTFNNLQLPALGAGLVWNTTQLYTSGILSVTGTTLTGDLNGDGFVGIADLNIVLGSWNQNVPPADPVADPSGDGFVGIEDLNAVLGNWNAGTPPSDSVNIPELATFNYLGLLVFGLLRRRGHAPHTGVLRFTVSDRRILNITQDRKPYPPTVYRG